MSADSYDGTKPNGDPFGPPAISTIVHCIHCNEEYDSYRIEWRVLESKSGPHGFWCCPIAGCDGRGFGFDIFPVDPEYRDEHGNLMWGSDESDDEDDDEDWEPNAHINQDDDIDPQEDIPY